jgi:prepilin-type N-terminal cleavage/methylation domain-containing protein
MSSKKQQEGFTLIEVIFSLFILALLALGLTKAAIYAQYTAEDNLYEATALTVAISTIEQMKGASLSEISSPTEESGKQVFKLIAGNGTSTSLILNEENVLDIPIITDSEGSASKTMPLTLIPKITPSTSNTGYWLELQYSYDHPKSGTTRTAVIRNIRSTVPVY